MNKRGFASDNNAGIHPNILKAIENANSGHRVGYGNDEYTQRAIEIFKEHFGQEADVYFVFNGTGANVLSISALTHPFHSVICPATAHIMVDECGAPERISGCKLIPIETSDGKLTSGSIQQHLHGFDFEHHSQPKIISISQTTEMGTVYSVEEIQAITQLAHEKGMLVHMDGARIANAAVSLGLPFRAFTTDAGVDVVSFGGTKNGMMFGEAVLFLSGKQEAAKFYRKQITQLYSKMRYVGAQFVAYFEDELWKRNAEHANSMAQLLAKRVKELGVEVTQKTDANGVFAIIDNVVRDRLQEKFFFYSWDENRNEVRWMTSFDTHYEDVDAFCNLLEELLNITWRD